MEIITLHCAFIKDADTVVKRRDNIRRGKLFGCVKVVCRCTSRNTQMSWNGRKSKVGTQQSIGKSVVQQFVCVEEYSLKPQL